MLVEGVRVEGAKRKVSAKVVCLGPGTGFEALRRRLLLKAPLNAETADVDGGRIPFFEHMPLELGGIGRMNFVVQVCSVAPSAPTRARAAALRGASGLIVTGDVELDDDLRALPHARAVDDEDVAKAYRAVARLVRERVVSGMPSG
jgi:hypothetical protein